MSSRSKTLDSFCTGVIALDLDGTIVERSDNYPEIGALKEAAVEWIAKLHEAGYRLYILTARPDIPHVIKWLKQQIVLDLIVERVTNTKLPETTIFVDDRGFRFEGVWNQATFDAIVSIMKYHTQCEQERLATPK